MSSDLRSIKVAVHDVARVMDILQVGVEAKNNSELQGLNSNKALCATFQDGQAILLMLGTRSLNNTVTVAMLFMHHTMLGKFKRLEAHPPWSVIALVEDAVDTACMQ